MATLREQIDTPLAIDDAFAFVADFANSSTGTPASPGRNGSTPAPLALVPAIAWASDCAAALRR